MKQTPPKWADRFLQWYCRPDLLEEIQGDAYELYYREVRDKKLKADVQFTWNVIRFFRLKNIRGGKSNQKLIPFGMIKNIIQVAFRNFFRQPGHSLLNVVGLSVSFLAAIFITLWVAHEFSYDRFHENPEQIFKVMSHVESNGAIETYDGAEVQMDVSSISEVSQKTIVMTGTRWPNELCFRPEGKENECIYLFGIYADEAFFSVFNYPILSGDPAPMKNPTNIAISENMAQRLYGNESPIGKTFKVDGYFPTTVASVFKNIPSNSSTQFDFVLPLAFYKRMRGLNDEGFGTFFLSTYLKTSHPVDAATLTKKLNEPQSLPERLQKDHVSYSAFPLPDWRLQGEFENGKSIGGRIQYVKLFLLVAALVVVMAVINFVNLTTARASTRSKEIGIRKVTGALRSGIVLQFVGESFMVVLVALAIAGLTAQLSLPQFNSLIGEQLTTSLLSPTAFVYAGVFLLAVALAAGLYPGIVMSSFQPAKVLKGILTTRNSGSQQLRKVLLVVQVSVSVGIIIFTGILFQQLSFIQNKNLGLDRENIIRVEPTYKLLQQYDKLKNDLLSHAEIKSITATNGNPLSLTGHTTGVVWPGMPEGTRPIFQVLGGTYELPETFGLSLMDGRLFSPKPTDTVNSEVLVTEEAVRLMNLKEPIGTQFKIGSVSCVIIGVVNDFHTESLREDKLPVVIYSHPTLDCSSLFIKYEPGTTQKSLAIIQEVYNQLEPAFTMKYTFQDEIFDNLYKTERIASNMIVFFTGISFIIAIIGVVGLSTYNVLRRKKEIGIKRVFGATIVQILSMLSREFIVLILLSFVVAVPVVWYSANSWLTSFAYRIDMPLCIFIASFFAIALVTIVLICLQAFKTVTTNPTQSLRNE